MNAQDEIRRYREMIFLARSLSGTTDFTRLLTSMLEHAQDIMRCEAVSIFIPDENSGELVIHSALGDKAPMLNSLRIPKGKGVAGHVFETHKKINCENTSKDSRHYKAVDEKTGFVTRAMLTLPLLNGSSCLGVLQMLNPIGREKFDTTDEEIGEGLAGLVTSTLLRVQDEARRIQEERVRNELAMAREIQQSFLPKRFVAFPCCQVHMTYQPAKEVGGDFCFAQQLGPGRYLMALGDVTGKGIPAALTMARATAELRASVRDLLDMGLGAWVSQLNQRMTQELQAGRFIGITFLLANTATGQAAVVAAGQYPPLRGNASDWRLVECPTQMPIGILPSFQYQSHTFPIHAGELWLLVSDGITEARNPSNEQLGLDRFTRALPVGLTAARTLEAATQIWRDFLAGQPSHDDASLLLLDWRGAAPQPEFELNCSPETLCEGRAFIERWARFAGFDDVTTGQIILACDEAASNVYRHAYHEKPGPLTYRIHLEESEIVIELIDSGHHKPRQEIRGRAIDELRPGGLGTFILSSVFDHIEAEGLAPGTRLELRKKLPAGAPPGIATSGFPCLSPQP